MLDTPPRAQPGSRAIPAGDLILPVLDLGACARRTRLPAPDVIGAGDMLARARPRPAPRLDPASPAAPAPRRDPPFWSAALERLRPAANDNRIRIAVLSAILALLVAHVAVDRISAQTQRIIEVAPPTEPGRLITSL